ncbi:MAG: biotin carboxylase, partial [Myxococcales bacterium]|nr:biotin carboxylase [Myxococcales bacterium]
GGGGKGQRILAGIPADSADPARDAAEAAARAPKAAREILGEVKAGGVGDNKNILVELNIEETRHNEIQLVGNGDWCVALGGRDCSLQMHEQKLLEVSITSEELTQAAAKAREAGRAAAAEALETDLATLRRMEAEAERFGRAVGLDSASTFECIVEGARHYFMEVNTRIQVEHRVTELCYALRFENPEAPGDRFVVTSLVEAMVLIARHGARLPRPTRVLREGAAVESRLNATDRSLSPHAGGSIINWSSPIPFEVRDDQGICVKNPDTGQFVRYRIAGAYDSNIALLVTCGDDRPATYRRLREILRRARLRGNDLKTNLEFHFGLCAWFLARDVYARPTTRFVVPYLTLVGELAAEAANLDLGAIWAGLGRQHEAHAKAGGPEVVAAAREAFGLKETLVTRPILAMFEEPHYLSAWLSENAHRYELEGDGVRWLVNPLEVLADLYTLLHMEWHPAAPAAMVVWDHDHALLETGLGFYARLRERLGDRDMAWPELTARLAEEAPPDGVDAALWARVRGSHRGFQCGLELLSVVPLVGARAGFFDLALNDDLTVRIPARLTDPAHQTAMRRVLAPPPEESPDLVVAVSGGMFYAQEAPDKPPFVKAGARFKAGDPLYMIEVMKMFNTVYAKFDGTVEEVLVSGGEGVIVRRGQPLFKVRPDEAVVVDDPAARAKRVREASEAYLAAIDGTTA